MTTAVEAFSHIGHVCLDVRMEQLGSHWTEFDEIWYFTVFLESVDKTQVSLKSNKNNGYFTWRRFHIYNNISLNSSYNEKRFRQKLYTKLKHTFYVQQRFPENRAVYDTMTKNVVEPERPQIIWRMRDACWITKVTQPQPHARTCAPTPTTLTSMHTHVLARELTHTSTHREIRNTYCFSTATMVSWTRVTVTLYVHCVSYYKINSRHNKM